MFCSTLLTVKVCSSVTTAVTVAATSCGTYKFIDVPVLVARTQCNPNEMQLMTSAEIGHLLTSPFSLSLREGGLIAAAVMLVWAAAFAWKSAQRALSAGSPE